jgi:hypothetical protein
MRQWQSSGLARVRVIDYGQLKVFKNLNRTKDNENWLTEST